MENARKLALIHTQAHDMAKWTWAIERAPRSKADAQRGGHMKNMDMR